MSAPSGIREYSGYSQSAVPDEMLSSSNPRMFQCELVQKVIANSTGSVSPNGRISFQIPSGENAFIKPCTAYIQATVSVSTTGATDLVYFRKSRLGNALFRTAQVSMNGQVVQRIDNLNDVNVINYCFGTNQNYYISDARIAEGHQFTAVANVATAVVQIPVALGVFNSNAIPLFCLPSNNILLEYETDAVANCMFGTTAGGVASAVVNYQLSDIQLVYESIQIDSSMAQMLRQEMASADQKWVIPFREHRVFQFAGASAVNVILGLNLSSVDSIFALQRGSPADAGTGDQYPAPAGTMKFDVYRDGKKVNNLDRREAIRCFSDLNLALSKLYDPTCSAVAFDGGALTRTLYTQTTNAAAGLSLFCAGQNLSKSGNSSLLLRGVPINSLQVDTSAFTSATLLIVVAHSSLMEIEPMSGLVTLIR